MSDVLPTDQRDRNITAVVERLRFGDSDGDDHDIAANELERLAADAANERAEAASWKAVAHDHSERLKQRDAEIDRLRATLEAIAAFPVGQFRPLADEIAIHKQATDALKQAHGNEPSRTDKLRAALADTGVKVTALDVPVKHDPKCKPDFPFHLCPVCYPGL